MKNKIGLTLLTFALFMFYANVYVFSPESGAFPALTSEFIHGELREVSIVFLYLLTSVCIYIEKDNLQEFHLDRTAILLFIGSSLFSIFQVRLLYFLVIIALAVWLSYIIVTRWRALKKTNWTWVSASVFYTLLIIIPATLIVLILVKNHPSVPNEEIPNIIAIFVFNIGLSAAREEIFFRSLLWGYLSKTGMSIKYSFIIQFALFWLLHYKGTSSDAGFFISLPLAAFTASLLAYKSKQLTPSIVSHALYNTLSPLLWRLFV